ncbi:MAG: extracellular solute-binding protein [Ruthenibacterium sp.]
MKKLNRILSLVLVLAMAATLASCAGQPSASIEQPIAAGTVNEEISGELVFWTQDSEVWSTWFQPAVEEFRKAYPNITITDEYFPSFSDKMTQSFAAGQQPDIAQTWQGVSEWAKDGKLLEIPASFGIETNYFEGATMSKMYEDKYYALPSEINIESPSLFVNMGLLKEQNIALPEGWVENNGPKTWQELLDFAKTLTKIENGGVMQSGFAYVYAQWEAMFASLIWQYGGDYRDAENGVVHFDTPEAHKAMEFLLKYSDPKDPDCVSDRGNSRYDLFAQGTAAMCVGAPWYASSFDIDVPDMEYQVFNMPAMVEGAQPSCLATGGWSFIVSSDCKYPEAAWAFVEFMNNAQNNGSWAKHCGTLPARKDAVMDLEYDPNVGDVSKALSIASGNLQYGKEDGAYMLTPSTLIYNIVRLQLQQALETGDIDTALKTMEKEGNAMIKANLGR